MAIHMDKAHHEAQGHTCSWLFCETCFHGGVTPEPLPATPAAPEPTTVTSLETRAMERIADRFAAPAHGICRRCGTYCDGDCTSAR